jgi:hypothetical protein
MLIHGADVDDGLLAELMMFTASFCALTDKIEKTNEAISFAQNNMMETLCIGGSEVRIDLAMADELLDSLRAQARRYQIARGELTLDTGTDLLKIARRA